MRRAPTRFSEIVGNEYVYVDDEVNSYQDPYSITDDEALYRAHAAVAPESTEQVQAIVRAANEFRIPL